MSESAIIEAQDALTESMMSRVSKLLAKAESTDSPAEAEALTEAAARISAKYGIDSAMLASRGAGGEGVIDVTVMCPRPFAEQMCDLLWGMASPMGMQATHIKSWNPMSGPKRRGGVPAGGYDFGLRVFGYRPDVERLRVLLTAARNIGLAGASEIKGVQKFGQDQRRKREDYLNGFIYGIRDQVSRAERDAKEQAEADEQEKRDRALLEGDMGAASGPGVALVLADRRKAVSVAMDLIAFGITTEDRARWARQAEERRAEVEAAKAAGTYEEPKPCEKCARAKSGACREHPRGRSYTRYDRKYEGAHWNSGYRDGQSANIGSGTRVGGKRGEIG